MLMALAAGLHALQIAVRLRTTHQRAPTQFPLKYRFTTSPLALPHLKKAPVALDLSPAFYAGQAATVTHGIYLRRAASLEWCNATRSARHLVILCRTT